MEESIRSGSSRMNWILVDEKALELERPGMSRSSNKLVVKLLNK